MKPYQDLNELKSKLTEQDIDALVALITPRCRHNTKARVRSILTYSAASLPSFGIFGRVMKDARGWEYCAGQDYTSEIKTVRDCILGKIY